MLSRFGTWEKVFQDGLGKSDAGVDEWGEESINKNKLMIMEQ